MTGDIGRTRGSGRVPAAVAIVSHDSAADLAGCLDAVAALTPGPQEAIIVDCASEDGSPDVARKWLDRQRSLPLTLLPLPDNRGFAGGMNAALARTSAPHVLSLNPDARPEPDYLARLLEGMEAASDRGLQVGAVTGRLVRPRTPEDPPGTRRLDACGMRLTSTWRHLDRGSGESDRGQYLQPERVFGATGAASLFRREALEDVALEGPDGGVFDPRFHSFREDAELALRLRERGWEVLYEPRAVCEHRRFNLPERRRQMSPEINRRSLQNRYLLRLYHQTAGNFWKTAVPTLLRDLLALGWVLLAERSSLSAYAWLWRHRREIFARRRVIQGRRTVPGKDLDRWFFTEGMPLDRPGKKRGEEREEERRERKEGPA